MAMNGSWFFLFFLIYFNHIKTFEINWCNVKQVDSKYAVVKRGVQVTTIRLMLLLDES